MPHGLLRMLREVLDEPVHVLLLWHLRVSRSATNVAKKNIWQGKIWSLSRDAEGWRPYNGGGMHDPDNVTGGHYDHLHVTVK